MTGTRTPRVSKFRSRRAYRWSRYTLYVMIFIAVFADFLANDKPLYGRYQHDAFILSNRSFKLAVTGIPIPFHIFQIRGRLGPDLQVLPGARAYAETQVLSIPTFGVPMVIAGLANKIWRKLVAMATYITRPYPHDGPANKRPSGVRVTAVEHNPPGTIVAHIQVEAGHSYPVDAHLAAILLVDADKMEAVPLDYHQNLKQTGDEAGNLRQVELALPKGVRVGEGTTVYVLLDLFPVYETILGSV